MISIIILDDYCLVRTRKLNCVRTCIKLHDNADVDVIRFFPFLGTKLSTYVCEYLIVFDSPVVFARGGSVTG